MHLQVSARNLTWGCWGEWGWQDTSIRQYFLLGGGGCHAQDRGDIGGMNEKKVKVVGAELVEKSGDSISASCPTQVSRTKLRCKEDVLPGIQTHIVTKDEFEKD